MSAVIGSSKRDRASVRARAIDYRPGQVHVQPLFVWPWRVSPFLKWLFGFPGYLWPWNAAYFLIALATWNWATPSLAAFKALAPWTIAAVLAQRRGLSHRLRLVAHTALRPPESGDRIQVQ